MPKGLTIAEERFAQELVRNGGHAQNAFEAAYGYCVRTHGYSSVGDVISRPDVQARIIELRSQVEAAARTSRDEMAREVAAIAYSNVADYLDHDGESLTLRPLGALTRRQAAAIKKISVTKDGRLEVELWDKLAAMRQLAQMCGYLQGDVNMQVTNYVMRAPAQAASAEDWEAQARAEGQVLDLQATAAIIAPPLPEK